METTTNNNNDEKPAGNDAAGDLAEGAAVSTSRLGLDQITVGGDTMTKSTAAIPDEKHRLMARWIYDVARLEKWGWKTLEAKTGISVSTFYRIWTGKYINPKTGKPVGLEEFCAKIGKFRELYDERRAEGRADFIETGVAKKTWWLARQCLVRRKIGFLYGESQIGKTTALREFARNNNHGVTSYVEMPPAAGVTLMVQHIAKALHVNARKPYNHLLDDVIAALDPNKLLIVDEVHKIFTTFHRTSTMRCVETLRYIYDQSGCGMLLCGTNVWRTELAEGEFFRLLNQMRRRGLYEVQLPSKPPAEDLALVRTYFGLPKPEGEAAKVWATLAEDGFGVLLTRLTDAKVIATRRSEDLRWDHFLRAVDLCERMARGGDAREEEAA